MPENESGPYTRMWSGMKRTIETLRAAGVAELRAEVLGPLLVRGEQVRGLLLLAERLAVEEEVLLPGDADLLGEDGRGDGGQLVVELLLAELAAQDQVRLAAR